MQYEDLTKILDEVLAKYRSLKDLDPVAQNEEMAKYLSTRTEFEASGAEPGGSWAWFKDGGLIIFDNTQPEDSPMPVAVSSSTTPPSTSETQDVPNDPQQTETQVSVLLQPLMAAASISDINNQNNSAQISALIQSLASNPTGTQVSGHAPSTSSSTHYGVPGSNMACLYTTFKECLWFGNVEICLKKDGLYNVTVVENAGVDELMNVPRCAVFGLNSHSSDMAARIIHKPQSKGQPGELVQVFSVYTSSLLNIVNWFKYEKMWHLGQVSIYHYIIGDGFHFAITDEFVKEYWSKKFDDNSFVYLDSCHSMRDISAGFRKALFDLTFRG